MNSKQVYHYMFHFLELVFFSDTKRYDNLGIVLGQMSPELFVGNQSSDPAVFRDFKDYLFSVRAKKDNRFSIDDGFIAVRKLLHDYNDKYGYDVINLLTDLEDIPGLMRKARIDIDQLKNETTAEVEP